MTAIKIILTSFILIITLILIILYKRSENALKLCFGPLPLNCVKIDKGHILVVGRTGSGKTNSVKVLIEEIVKRHRQISILVLDWAGEYDIEGFLKLRPSENLRFNMASTFSDDHDQFVEFLVDVFSSIYELTEPQAYMLYKSLRKLSPPIKLHDIVDSIENLEVRNYKEIDIKAALLRRLEPLNNGILGRVLNGNTTFDVFLNKNVIVDLSSMESIKHKILLTLIILRKIYDYNLRRGFSDNIKHITVIEEAWTVLPYRRREDPPSIGERLFLELRKYGECLVAVTQSITDVSERVVKNANLIIVHRTLQRDLEILGKYFSEQLELLPKKIGEALIITEDMEIKKIKVRKSKT